MVVQAWTPSRDQASFHALSVALEWATTSSTAASTVCTRNAVGSSAWQRILITDVHGARELHASLTGDHIGKQVETDKLEVEASFCYLRDMLSAAGGCELSTTTCVKTVWNKFEELLLILFPPPLFQDNVVACTACVQRVMLHASETWPLTKPNFQHLQQNDRAMIRQICIVKPQDK